MIREGLWDPLALIPGIFWVYDIKRVECIIHRIMRVVSFLGFGSVNSAMHALNGNTKHEFNKDTVNTDGYKKTLRMPCAPGIARIYSTYVRSTTTISEDLGLASTATGYVSLARTLA